MYEVKPVENVEERNETEADGFSCGRIIGRKPRQVSVLRWYPKPGEEVPCEEIDNHDCRYGKRQEAM
jgi:hypothetical protein